MKKPAFFDKSTSILADIFLFVGLCLMGYGLFLFSPGLAFAVCGLFLMAIGLFLGRGE